MDVFAKRARTRKLILCVCIVLILTISTASMTFSAYALFSKPGPHITSVSKITTNNYETIFIAGFGFGNIPPQTVSLGDGSVDTYACNAKTPSLEIFDNGSGMDHWAAGLADCQHFDTLGVFISSGMIH